MVCPSLPLAWHCWALWAGWAGVGGISRRPNGKCNLLELAAGSNMLHPLGRRADGSGTSEEAPICTEALPAHNELRCLLIRACRRNLERGKPTRQQMDHPRKLDA